MANRLTAPAAVIATWPEPNYIDPVTQGLSLQWLSIALSAFGLLTVVLRCYTRIFLTRAFGIDDGFIIAALGLCMALSAVLIWGIRDWYLGYHIWDLPAHSVVDHLKGAWIASFLTVLSSCAIRVSILLFYRRLSVRFTRGFLIATWVGIAYNIGLAVSLCLANTFICWPVQAYWNRYDLDWRQSHDWKCSNEGLSLPISGILTVIGDLYCTILPLVLVSTLKIPQRQKIALYLLFGLGFFVCGAGITRTTMLAVTVWTTYDFTWKIYDMWIWNTVELYSGILVACAPALKPLLRMVVGSRFLGYTYTYGSYDSRDLSGGAIKSKGFRDSAAIPADGDRIDPDTKGVPSVTRSISRHKKETRPGRYQSTITRTPSLISASSSTNQDRASIESFPTRKSRSIRIAEPGSPIIEEVNEWRRSHPPVEVDPPIFPASVAIRPLAQPNRSSEFIGDGLRAAESTPPQSFEPEPQDDSLSGLSSPAPVDNQYLTNTGWVELRPVKEARGSVTAARLRAGAQNHSRSVTLSPPPKAKPYFDAESSHEASFVATPLPRLSPAPRTSDEFTRLNYSDSSRALSQGFSKFQLDLRESPVTALPDRSGRW